MEYNNYKTLKTEVNVPGILELNLNIPDKLNAWNNEMINEMYDITTKLKGDSEIKAVVLSGEGTKGFCGGLDVRNVFTPEVVNSIDLFYDAQCKMGNTIINISHGIRYQNNS